MEARSIAEIIDKLAGEKSNLRVDIQDIIFTIGGKQYELAGQVYFNVIRQKDGKSSYEERSCCKNNTTIVCLHSNRAGFSFPREIWRFLESM